MDDSVSAELRINLLGGIYMRSDTLVLSGLLTNKAAALLAYLCMTRRPHQRDSIAALLWCEQSEADAHNNLRQTLTNLRKVVGPWLLISRESVGFDQEMPYTLDVWQFEQFIERSRRVTTVEDRMAQLESAVAVYRGDLLCGFHVRDAETFDEWVDGQRLRLHRLALHALFQLANIHLQQGHYGRTIDYATQTLALESWNEEAHRQLIEALYCSGQRSPALMQYESCRQILWRTLAVEPSAEMQALYQRLRSGK